MSDAAPVSRRATPFPTTLVVFGATGDLMAKKVVPSLFYLQSKELLPEEFRVVAFGRRPWGDEDLRGHVRAIMAEKYPDAGQHEVDAFLGYFHYFEGQFDDASAYDGLAVCLKELDSAGGGCSNKLFYLAVPPEYYALILQRVADAGLTLPCSDTEGWTRVLVEKPFGDDEASSRALDELLQRLFREEQIYRIDHYLAKEMLQGIMNFRFQNNLLETSWNRDAVERIDIDLLESLGVEGRGAFYDNVGALRDVGQNHLLQMLALVTMDRPDSPRAEDVRSSRARAIATLMHPMSAEEVARGSFRAQYDGYLGVAGVAPGSETETYFMLRTTLAGPRWAGVPVTMQSGKRMGEALKRITVSFKHPEECFCAPGQLTNKVVFSLEPNDTIDITFYAKRPGFSDETEERTFRFFLYERTEKLQYVEEYGRLLYDAIAGDQTLFVSSEEVRAGWRFTDAVVDAWHDGVVPLERYEPDSAKIVERVRAALESFGRTERHPVGVVGLGKMGAGLARNLIDHGWPAVGWNRHGEVARAMQAEGLVPASTIEELASLLPAPRVVWVMLPAGHAVEAMLFGADGHPGLADVLEAGDVVLDGGNSFFEDAPRRAALLAERGIGYMDVGTSGGPSGARYGACLMIGGDPEAFQRLEPMFADVSVAAGYARLGPVGAGHFVKMVHNGIEYGMMQAIAEGFAVLHHGVPAGRGSDVPPAALDLTRVADIYQHGSVIESRLVGWLEEAYGEFGDDLAGVSGIVGHSGEGEWTIQTAERMDIDVPVIAASLQYRLLTELGPDYLGQVLTALRNAFGGHGTGPGGGPRR